MKQPTVEMPGSAIGDAVGISWLLKDVDGVRIVGHGGTTNGHHSEFLTVPERDFAIICMTNCGPNGAQMNDELLKWALEAYLGVTDVDPEAVALGDAALAEYSGTYETVAVWAHLTVKDGGLELNVEPKPETIAQMQKDGEEVPEQPPIPLGFLAGEGDRYIVTGGPAKGMKGYFVRKADGVVDAVHVGGRLATRVN